MNKSYWRSKCENWKTQIASQGFDHDWGYCDKGMTYCDGENDDKEVMLIEITTQIADEALIKIMAEQCKMTCYDEGAPLDFFAALLLHQTLEHILHCIAIEVGML